VLCFVCQIFSGVFALEALVKIMAFGLLEYLKNRWNCLDLSIVVINLIELSLQNVKGLSIMRIFRLLRLVCSHCFFIYLISRHFIFAVIYKKRNLAVADKARHNLV